MRSVRVAGGCTPTTRTPCSRAPLPIAFVNAASPAFAAAPQMYSYGWLSPAMPAPPFPHRLGNRDEPRVRRRAADLFVRMALARHADDVDDDAALARLHARIELARQVDEAEYFQLPGVPPLRFVDRVNRAARN